MPQPSLGPAARSKVVTLRVTQDQYDQLVAKGGTATKGAYAVIREALGKSVTRAAGAAKASPAKAQESEVVESGPTAAAAEAPHRHRRGQLLREEFDQGAAVKVYACQTCGKAMR